MSQTTTSHAEEVRMVEIVKQQPKLSKAEEAAAKKAAKQAAKAEKEAAKAKEAAVKKAAKEAAKAEKEAAKAEKEAAKAAKKAAQELEKQRKAEERAAKKAATEAKKAAAAEKKAEKQEKKKQKKQTNITSSVTHQIAEVNAANNGELQQEEIFESKTEVDTASLDEETKTTPEKQKVEKEMAEWTKEHDALIKATEQHQLEEEEEEEEQEEEVEEEPNCKVVGPAEIQERLEAMKKVVLTARANLAAFETAYNELSELLGSESQV